MKNLKQLIITESNNELAKAIKELKSLENQVTFHNSRIKELKDKIKESDYTQILFKNDKEQIICSISKYTSERISWDREFLEKELPIDKFEKAQKKTIINNVRITLK